MGCKHSNDKNGDIASDMNIHETWKRLCLQEPEKGTFSNQFEVSLFKALNLIRLDPKWAIPHIRKVRGHKHYTGANVDMVIQILKKQKCLPALEVNINAMSTCKKANEELQTLNIPKY